MKRFFIFSLLYLAVAMAVIHIFRENPAIQIYDAMTRTIATLKAFAKYLPFILGVLAAIFLVTRNFAGKKVATEGAWALAGCLVFSVSFTFMKTSLPYIVPFFADPLFADIDKALHGGVDPWVLTHKLAPYIPANAVSTLYFIIWGLPAAFFPFLLAVTDTDEQRKKTYLILFAFVWIGLGNVIAYSGASVGPIYYDRLLGGDRFADLLGAVQSSGLGDTKIGMVQNGLWHVFSNHSQMVGSGISAFPSVHNGVAALIMFYLFERSKWLGVVGAIFCAAILFCSVYVGWHYAIDGYFSILAVAGAWWGLRKWNARKPAVDAEADWAKGGTPAPIPAE